MKVLILVITFFFLSFFPSFLLFSYLSSFLYAWLKYYGVVRSHILIWQSDPTYTILYCYIYLWDSWIVTAIGPPFCHWVPVLLIEKLQGAYKYFTYVPSQTWASSMGGVTYVMNSKQLQPFNRQRNKCQYQFSFSLGQSAKFISCQYFRRELNVRCAYLG